ncbi:MAG: GNAT family N-acetyltransferase [Chloroflexota bacterium]
MTNKKAPSTPQLNLPISMVRDTLDNLPTYSVPSPYVLRWYQPGDEIHWLDIQVQSNDFAMNLSLERYRKSFGQDVSVLAERQAFLCDQTGYPIGTASAWFDDDYAGQAFGQVHWVAIRPNWQGKGLGNALLSTICHRLRDLGHGQTYLHTSTARTPAIKLYLKFGFVPEIRGDGQADREAWALVKQAMSHSALAAL